MSRNHPGLGPPPAHPERRGDQREPRSTRGPRSRRAWAGSYASGLSKGGWSRRSSRRLFRSRELQAGRAKAEDGRRTRPRRASRTGRVCPRADDGGSGRYRRTRSGGWRTFRQVSGPVEGVDEALPTRLGGTRTGRRSAPDRSWGHPNGSTERSRQVLGGTRTGRWSAPDSSRRRQAAGRTVFGVRSRLALGQAQTGPNPLLPPWTAAAGHP